MHFSKWHHRSPIYSGQYSTHQLLLFTIWAQNLSKCHWRCFSYLPCIQPSSIAHSNWHSTLALIQLIVLTTNKAIFWKPSIRWCYSSKSFIFNIVSVAYKTIHDLFPNPHPSSYLHLHITYLTGLLGNQVLGCWLLAVFQVYAYQICSTSGHLQFPLSRMNYTQIFAWLISLLQSSLYSNASTQEKCPLMTLMKITTPAT